MNTKTKKILIASIFLFGLVIILFFVVGNQPQTNTPEEAIKDYYQTAGDKVFVSKNQVVSAPEFDPEIKELQFNPESARYAVFYEVENYLDVDLALITDFFLLTQTKTDFWEVTNYETTYASYIEQDNSLSKDDVWNTIKENIDSGNINSGLTPEQISEIESNLEIPEEGNLIGVKQSIDGSVVVEAKTGRRFGENYLELKDSDQKLSIENISTYAVSEDGKNIYYMGGEYKIVLGQVMPDGKVWKYDLEANTEELIYQYDNQSLPSSLYATSDRLFVGTTDRVLLIDLNTKESKVIHQYEYTYTFSEDFILPEVLTVGENLVQISVPVGSGREVISISI